MRRADAIVVSTEDLAEMLPRGLPVPTILPTVPDPDAFQVVNHPEGASVIVGWAGTVGGLGYLDPLASVFKRLAEERVARLVVVSSRPWPGPSEFRRWRLEEETTLFGNFSIGIMPLPDTEYTRAKAGFKLLQYMAAGIPVVSSPIGVNRELIENSQAGLLATTPDEWEDALRALAGDHKLRAELGGRGRAFVERYADLDGQARTLARLLGA
jgi:glycosyltransferase involved in cell wall biosynthesis